MAKINGMPTSIRAGIPKLPETPAGWKREKLSKHLFEIKRPINLEPERSYRLVTVKRSRGGVEERSCLLGREIKTPSQFLIEAGDFLISKRQIVHGACGIVPANLAGSVVSNEYAVIGTKGGIDLTFLQYLSESMYFQQTCFHSSIGVHVEKMIFNVDRWLNWHFNIPPLPEQKEIVAILSSLDEAIKVVSKLIISSKEQKKSLMHVLMSGIKRTSKLNTKWQTVKLGDLIIINPTRPSISNDAKVSFVPMAAVSEDAKLTYVLETEYGEVSKGFSSFINNDILIAKITPCFENGKGAVVSNLSNGIGFGSTEFHVLRPKKEVSARFVYHVTNSHEFRLRGKANMQGSAGQKRVPTDFIRRFKFSCPMSYDEQSRIATIIDNLDSQFENYKAQYKLLIAQKKYLLQQLLFGNWRVKMGKPASVSLYSKVQP